MCVRGHACERQRWSEQPCRRVAYPAVEGNTVHLCIPSKQLLNLAAGAQAPPSPHQPPGGGGGTGRELALSPGSMCMQCMCHSKTFCLCELLQGRAVHTPPAVAHTRQAPASRVRLSTFQAGACLARKTNPSPATRAAHACMTHMCAPMEADSPLMRSLWLRRAHVSATNGSKTIDGAGGVQGQACRPGPASLPQVLLVRILTAQLKRGFRYACIVCVHPIPIHPTHTPSSAQGQDQHGVPGTAVANR